MILLKRSLIAVSTLLLAVGIFTSCSDGDDDGGYLSCSEANAKQLEMLECTTESCTADIISELCGGASEEECLQHYKTECDFGGGSDGDYDFLSCDEIQEKAGEAGCDGATYIAQAQTTCGATATGEAEIEACVQATLPSLMMSCAMAKPGFADEVCADAPVQECAAHYAVECTPGASL